MSYTNHVQSSTKKKSFNNLVIVACSNRFIPRIVNFFDTVQSSSIWQHCILSIFADEYKSIFSIASSHCRTNSRRILSRAHGTNSPFNQSGRLANFSSTVTSHWRYDALRDSRECIPRLRLSHLTAQVSLSRTMRL